MNIPPKYEDLVAKLDEALGREAALREELESIKASVYGYDSPEHAAQVADEMGHQCNALQQRLTVEEQRAGELSGLLRDAVMAHGKMLLSDPPQEAWKYHRISERISDALKPAAEAKPIGWRCDETGIIGKGAVMTPVFMKPAEEGKESARKDLKELREAVNAAARSLTAGIEMVKVPGILQAKLNEALDREKHYKERISGLESLLDDVIRNPMTKVH